MSRIFPVLLLSLTLLSPALPLRAAEGLPATPQAAVDALSLERDIHALMRDKKALAGVALLTEDGLCAGVHMDTPFPLLSVIKFPLAVAVLEKMQQEHTPLTTRIPVRAGQLHPDTHSPLRDKYGQRDVRLSLQELLHATITFSDNNGCDILMEYVGGPSVVEACARRLGADSVFIGHNEDWMHQNIYNQYANWGTPRSMARMLLGFFSSPDIPQAHNDFMTGIMAKTPALPGKILEGLPQGMTAGHKTGSSDRTAQGVKLADNDLAFFRLPDGRYVALAVFLCNSLESPETNLSLITDITRLSVDWLARQPMLLRDGAARP